MTREHIKTATVSSKGQVVIPEQMREDLNITKGTHLLLIETKGVIIMKKESDVIDTLSDVTKYSEHSLHDIWDGPEEDVWNQYVKQS